MGNTLTIGLKEALILAAILIAVALVTDPVAVWQKLRGGLGKIVPFLAPKAGAVADTGPPADFLTLHAQLTELSLDEGGIYNEPLAALYQTYLTTNTTPPAAPDGPVKPAGKGGAK